MQHDHILKKLNFDICSHPPMSCGGGGGGEGGGEEVSGQNSCYYVAAFVKKLNLDPYPRVGRGDLRVKYLLPCCCM